MFDQMILPNQVEICNPPASSDRRATAWLSDRIKKGRKDRFPEYVRITPHLAGEMLKCQENNRPLSAPTVERYSRIMQEGGWKLTSEGLAFDKTGKLQNGQHRLNAVIESGCTISMTVWFGTETEEFDFLDQNRDRSAGDLIAIHKLDYWNVRAVVARLALLVESESEKDSRSERQNAVLVKEKAILMATPLMQTALRAGQASKRVLTDSSGTFAYYWIGSHTRRPELLAEFWARLATGVGISAADPLSKIRDPMMTGQIGNKSGVGTALKRTAAIILAWNAMVSGRRKFNFEWTSSTTLPEVL